MHADCEFSDFDGHRVVSTWWAGTTSFVNCTFSNNVIFPWQQWADSSVVYANGFSGEQPTQVRLQGCTFSGGDTTNASSTIPTLLASDAQTGPENGESGAAMAHFFSDADSPAVCTSYSGVTGVCAAHEAPQRLETSGERFLSVESPWLEDVAKVRACTFSVILRQRMRAWIRLHRAYTVILMTKDKVENAKDVM